MPETCCVVDCHNRRGQKKPGLPFHRFPVDAAKREKWVAAVRREGWRPTEHSRVCGEDFVSGRKSGHPLSPDYIPTLFPYLKTPEKSKRKGAVEKFESRQLFKQKKREEANRMSVACALLLLSAEPDSKVDSPVESRPSSPDFTETQRNAETQTDMCGYDIVRLQIECNNLRKENVELKEQNKNYSIEQSGFCDNDNKVKHFTGLASYNVLMILFKLILPFLNLNMKLDPLKQMLLTLMRLRLSLNVQYLAYTFGVSKSTVSKVYLDVLHIMYSRLVPTVIVWPEREFLRKSLPLSFRSKFRRCCCIIDCFEIFTEKASDFNARNQTYSNYKSHNTTKYLIGITPQGVISFISKGWGGRTSDKTITEQCGFLDNLLPGDLILADRGFDIGDSVGLCSATLKIPAFTKGKKQLNPIDVEATRGLASARIHVERVIGMVRQKYSILSSTIPITLLQADESGLTTLDKIVHVCSALVNLCEPIVPFD